MSRLSIFSFNTLQPWKTFPFGLLTCLLILIGVEVVVARSDWIVDRFSVSSLGIMSALEDEVIRKASPEIICFGNSRLRDGLSPRILEQQLGMPKGSVLNLALTAGKPYDSLVMYRRNREIFRHAKIMIIDFEYHYFGRAPEFTSRVGRHATFEDRVRLFEGREQLMPALIGGIWHTFGIRDYLRALMMESSEADTLVIADDGRIVWRDAETDEQINIKSNIKQHASKYETDQLDSGHAQELQRLIAMAQQDGIVILLLHVPVRGEFARYLKETYPKKYEQLHRKFTKYDFDVDLILDPERGDDVGILDQSYFDYGHMTDDGSKQLSEWIAPHLKRLLEKQSEKKP
jgi:hypothetical protein